MTFILLFFFFRWDELICATNFSVNSKRSEELFKHSDLACFKLALLLRLCLVKRQMGVSQRQMARGILVRGVTKGDGRGGVW